MFFNCRSQIEEDRWTVAKQNGISMLAHNSSTSVWSFGVWHIQSGRCLNRFSHLIIYIYICIFIYIYIYIYICMIHVVGMIKNDFYMFGMRGNHQLAIFFFFSFSFLLSSKGCTTRVEHGRDVAVLYSKMLVDHFFDFDKVACWSQADIDATAYHGKKLQRLYPW